MIKQQAHGEYLYDDEEEYLRDEIDDCSEKSASANKIANDHIAFRERARMIIHSQKFHIAVITLVIADVFLVVFELLIDMSALQKNQHEWQHLMEFILKCCSIIILSIFLLENLFKIYAMQIEFLQHYLEMFDAAVVVTSLIFDIIFINDHSTSIGLGLIIVLRLWRIVRVINGIVWTVKAQSDKLLEKEKRRHIRLLAKLKQIQQFCKVQNQEIKSLRHILDSHGIEVPKSTVFCHSISNVTK